MYKQSWKLLVYHIAELVSIPNYTTLHTQSLYSFYWVSVTFGTLAEWNIIKKKKILSTDYYLNH